jgi:hypothetical protein
MKARAMKERAPAAEVTEVHTRLLKCALCIDEARAYWAHVRDADLADERTRVLRAFELSWFGPKSMPWVMVLVSNFRLRFDAYPQALEVLSAWRDMPADVRRLVCHVHLQLTDPLYRAFTGDYLVRRRSALRAEVTRPLVTRWVEDQGAGRWTVSTRVQFASRLLSCALDAGLLRGTRDPRELVFPRVPDQALTYVLHLLRDVQFAGSMVRNPYLASLGLEGALLEERLRSLEALRYARVGDVIDLEWRYGDLADWARHTVLGGGA